MNYPPPLTRWTDNLCCRFETGISDPKPLPLLKERPARSVVTTTSYLPLKRDAMFGSLYRLFANQDIQSYLLSWC